MPNAANADAPITLLGIGRSGTTLLEACFRAHPDIQSLNETSGLIFSTATGAHSALVPAANDFPDRYAFDGHAIRQLLLALEPSACEHWFHKPIGVPKLISWWCLPGEKSTSGFPIEWYWRVLESAFPRAKYLACLRNPWDVVLSWERFAGWKQKDLWRDLLVCYRMLERGLDRFRIVICFDDLIQRPAPTLQRVFNALDLTLLEQSLAVYDKPQAMKGHRIMHTHQESWSTCERPNLSEEEAAAIVALWKRQGFSFESPHPYASLFAF